MIGWTSDIRGSEVEAWEKSMTTICSIQDNHGLVQPAVTNRGTLGSSCTTGSFVARLNLKHSLTWPTQGRGISNDIIGYETAAPIPFPNGTSELTVCLLYSSLHSELEETEANTSAPVKSMPR